jgi:ComF family protein
LAMQPISGETCDICGERLSGLQRLSDLQTCAACQEARPNFAKAAAYGFYEGDPRKLIHLLKYAHVVPAAGALGKMLAEAIGKLGIGSGPVLVISVPLHSSKRRQRGFNQAELIARDALKQPRMARPELATDVLERRRPTVSQIGPTRLQRSQNTRGAFRVVHRNRVSGRNVLLVDDVLTTGTTASKWARVLRRAGANRVWVATVARTLKNSVASFEIKPEFKTAAQAS